jgi:hypothetical protein
LLHLRRFNLDLTVLFDKSIEDTEINGFIKSLGHEKHEQARGYLFVTIPKPPSASLP